LRQRKGCPDARGDSGRCEKVRERNDERGMRDTACGAEDRLRARSDAVTRHDARRRGGSDDDGLEIGACGEMEGDGRLRLEKSGDKQVRRGTVSEDVVHGEERGGALGGWREEGGKVVEVQAATVLLFPDLLPDAGRLASGAGVASC
jgi:hypothetical protein